MRRAKLEAIPGWTWREREGDGSEVMGEARGESEATMGDRCGRGRGGGDGSEVWGDPTTGV